MSGTANEVDVGRWREAVALDVRSNYHFEMGRALLRQNELQAATIHLRQAFSILPEHWAARVVLTDLLCGQGQSAMAARAESGLDARSPHWEAQGRRQLLREELDNHEWSAAVAHGSLLVELPGTQPCDHWLLGIAIAMGGERAAGIRRLASVPVGAVDIETVRQTHRCGYLEYGCGNHQAASAIFDECVRMAPDDSGVQGAAGIAHHSLGALDKALPRLRRAVALDPGSAGLWHSFSLVLIEKGLLDEADRALRQACVLAPDNIGAQSTFALTALRRGQIAEALRISTDCVARDRQSLARSAMNRALVLAVSGRVEEAVEQFRYALQTGPAIAHAAIPMRGWARETLERIERLVTGKS